MSLPTRGDAYQLSTELAGLGGDTFFAKCEGAMQFNVPLYRQLSLGLHMRCGGAVPLGGPVNTVLNRIGARPVPDSLRVIDRFFLGGNTGNTALRGYEGTPKIREF